MFEEKVRKTLYKLIEQYYRILKKQYKRTEFEYNMVEVQSELEQSLIKYETSIFKYIENKQLPFTELFRLNQERIYSLNEFETELLRIYVGVYDNGKKQSIQEVGKRLDISTNKASTTLKEIMDNFESETGQLLLINDRNNEVRKRIYNKEFRQQILDSDITFLNITDNFLDILRQENINKVNDLLKITKTQIQDMNIQYGYFDNIEIIPQRLIDEIHKLGLRFENEKMIDIIFKKFKDESNDKTNEKNVLIDAISARQFEPELLERFDSINDPRIDLVLNIGYIQEKYKEFIGIKIEETIKTMKLNELDYKHGKIYQSHNN